MKKNSANKLPSQASKISDFFFKTQGKNADLDSKRKHMSHSSQVLNSVTNLPEKCEINLSPPCKKIKQEEYISVNENNHKSHSFHGNVYNSFHHTPEKGMRPSTSMKTPSSQKGSSRKSTPSKKGTPKKLFEKSPRRLEEFNVQILEAFVKVSPSTSNKKIRLQTTPQKGCVYSLSAKAASVRTPSRTFIQTTLVKSTTASPLKSPKFRTKLNFLDSIDVVCKVEKMEQKCNPSLQFDDSLDDDFLLIKCEEENYTLNLKDAQHCTVVEVEENNGGIVLTLKCNKDGTKGQCCIEEFWACSHNFTSGDTVYICAEQINNKWVVNNENGWLVYEPDTLISCTSVVGSLFCKRRAVLSDRFRACESNNRVMTIGMLAHTLLQQSLSNKLRTNEDIKKLLRRILDTKDTVKKLYESDLRMDEIESELQTFVPKLVSFISEYVNREAPPDSRNWQGKICDIDDIEENLWCPESGTKGKIDVTVQTENGVMPLEMKTGRATVSMEHRGQVVLYIMMMNKFGYEVSSGLLLYLREGVLKEIKATPQEKRDILILRNELAYFLHRNVNKDIKQAPQLPKPLNNHRVCVKCPYNVVCTSYLNYENCDVTRNKGIKEVQAEATAHLTQAHLDYFLLWSNLLTLEGDSNRVSKSVKQIYTVPPAKREASGRCLTNLKITLVEAKENGIYEHTFEKEDPNFNLAASGLVENNYVVVSTNSRPAVATGFVTNMSSLKICTQLDRNLEKKYPGQLFHLDTYDSNITYTFNMSNLALLLENTPQAAKLRRIIIDKEPPTFVSKLPSIVAKKGAVILKRLNIVQQKAVLKALCANDFLLIKGMPGTGKSATIVALIQLLVELGKSVLITSHTHSAIDNICIRLQKRKEEFLRLGSESKIDSSLKSNTEATLLKNCTTPQEMEETYNKYKIIAVTCLGSGHPLLSKRMFDVCLVDESTQVVQTSVVKPLYAAKTFILFGDPNQLAPVVKNQSASNAGMSESLFERLENSQGTITLNLNYRMNETITNLANALTYNGELKAANYEVANRTLKIPNLECIKIHYRDHPWLLRALDTSLETAVQVVDTGPTWEQPLDVKWRMKNQNYTEYDSQNCINVHEVAIAVTLVKALLMGGVENNDIGVIATYRAQVDQISNFLEPLGVDVSTVDQFQGRDKSVVVFSCTKSTNACSNDPSKMALLEDKRRLTVAITRAKRKLLIVGDVSTLKRFSTFATILPVLKNNIIKFDSTWGLVNSI